MIEFTIESPSLNRLRARLLEAPRIVSEELRAGTETAVEETVREVRSRTPGQGGLRGAIRGQVSGGGAFITARVFVADARYRQVARWMEEGTRAHVIVPRYAKVLRWSDGGRARFSMRVMHPGTRPYHFLRDGWAAAKPRVRRIFSARLGRVTRRLSGR